MTLLQRQLQSVFEGLPDAVRTLLLSPDFNGRVEVLGQKRGLDDIQSSDLVRLTTRLLAGIIQPTQFIALLIDTLEVTREEAALIAQDVNKEIFTPVKEALKEVHKIPPSLKPGTDASPRPVSLARPTPVPSSAVPRPSSVPGEIPPVTGSTPPHSAWQAQKSILEQKLSGTFVAPPAVSAENGEVSPPPPVPTIPPPIPPRPPTPAETLANQMFAHPTPETTRPPRGVVVPPPSDAPGAVDPYRESV